MDKVFNTSLTAKRWRIFVDSSLLRDTLKGPLTKHFSLSRFIACCLLAVSTQQHATDVTVLYPETKSSYKVVFEQINTGIKQRFNGDVTLIPVPRVFDPKVVAKDIKTDKVIALGSRGRLISKQIYKHKTVVVGASPISPNGLSGISLKTSPEILFQNLKQLAPSVTTIHVVYTPTSKWIIEQAKNDAQLHNLKLNTLEVSNLKQASKIYSDLFKQKNIKGQAIWLPLDAVTANDKVIVPVILENAWKNKMIVFSSKPNHAQRGALFSAVPDHLELGHQLADLVNKLNKQPENIVKPLKDIKLAVNLRTAAHLGYNYNQKQRALFAVTFPN